MNPPPSTYLPPLICLISLISQASADLTPDQKTKILAAAPTKARATPKQPRRILIWNTPYMEASPHKGYTIPQAAFAMKTLGEKTGAFQGTISDDQTLLLPENIRRFDAIILNNANGPWTKPTEAALAKFRSLGKSPEEIDAFLRRSFIDYVKSGGGLVAYHHAIGVPRDWEEFFQMLGATYWGHPWNEEVGVKLDEPDHPLLAAFGGKPFRIAEEVFQYKAPYSRDRQRVLLSLDTETTNMTVPWIHRKDGDFGLAWVRRHGDGRVFYSAFGHRTEIWWNRTILQFYLDGIQFATGDLDAPADPR